MSTICLKVPNLTSGVQLRPVNVERPLDQLTDEQLVSMYRTGRTEAFELLVGRFRHDLLHFLVLYVGDRSLAEDLFQETFLQVHLSTGSFDTSRRFKPWVFTIAANKARDYLRRTSRRQITGLSGRADDQQEGRSFIDLLEADLPLPDEDAESEETRRLVREAIEALPDHLREVLLLAYFHRFPYKEIAEMLEIPLGTVKSRLHAAVGTFADFWVARHGVSDRR